MPVSILIVDDHEVLREGIRSILSRVRPQWKISGEASNGADAIAAAARLQPTIILLDVTMPGMSGLEAASKISKLGLASQILIFTMHESGQLANDARRCGARGCLGKSDAARHLILAIETLLSGGTFFGKPEHQPKPDAAPADPNPGPAPLLRLALGYCI
jgi:DNA-binding NarL/FixJ family response regulator